MAVPVIAIRVGIGIVEPQGLTDRPERAVVPTPHVGIALGAGAQRRGGVGLVGARSKAS